jgi:uncharacterized membrane protein
MLVVAAFFVGMRFSIMLVCVAGITTAGSQRQSRYKKE